MIGNRRESEASVARSNVIKAPSATPLTAVTKASTSALGYTPNSVATLYDENKSISSSSRMSLKNTKDIVAQWKKEREQGRNKLSDIMNTIPNQRSSKKQMQVTIQEEPLPYDKLKDQKEDELLEDIFRQQNNALSPEAYDNSTQASSPNFTTEESIRTTPTGNTALNAYGIEKLCNRNTVGSMNGKSLNVRLFQTGALKEEDTAQDVSMMTQDTELHQMIPHNSNDANQVLSEIQKEKDITEQEDEEPEPDVEDNSVIEHHPKTNMRQSSGTVSDALSSMQASLEKSRLIRERQEKLLAKQEEEIQRMKQEKVEWLKGQEAFQSALGNSVEIVLEQLYNIHNVCGIQSSQDFIVKKDQPIVTILNLMEDLSSKHIPDLMASIEDLDQRQVEAKANLVDILAQSKEADTDLAFKKEKLSSLENQLKEADGQLDDMMNVLREEQNEIDAKKVLLVELEKEVDEKQNDLAEIDRLCDERVAVAHETEINAKEIADEVARQDKEVKEMFEAVQRRQDSVRVSEKSLRLKIEEFESSKLASEARLHLKESELDEETKRIEEQRSQLDEFEASLNERHLHLEEEYSNVQVVKRDLVDKEAAVDEREKVIDQEKLELEQRANTLKLSEDELKRKQEELEQHIIQAQNQDEEISRRENDLHLRSVNLDQKVSEFEDEREEFMRRVKALEDGESDLEARTLALADQNNAHNEAIKSFQIQSENKERAISKMEAELDAKRHDIESQVNALLEQKAKIEAALTKERGELKDLYQERKDLQHEISGLESKHQHTSASFDELNTEITKARYMAKKKLAAAKDELEILRQAFDDKEAEIGSLSEQEQKLRNEVDQLLRIKDEIVQTISVKEGLLKQVEANIKSSKDEWGIQKLKELEDNKNEILKNRQDVMIDIAKQKDAARLEMIEMSKTFYSKQEELMNKRAHQLELLHSQLEKLSQKISLDREKLTIDRNALDSEIGDRKVLQERIDCLTSESKVCANQIQDLSEQLEKSKEKGCALEADIVSYKEQIQQLSEQLHMEKETNTKLLDNIVSLNEKIIDSSKQRELLQQKEDELRKEQEVITSRAKELEEGEKRMAELDLRETTIRDDFEALVELQEIVSNEKIRIESESKKIEEARQALDKKEAKVSAHEKKLKEYTLQLQKQNTEIKEKEKSLQQAVRLFSDRRNESANRDAAQISELKQALVEEQERYSSLYQKYQEIRSSDHEIQTQERIRQIALQLKTKDEELTRNQQKLEEKLAKCDECEKRLQEWQNELEALAATLRSEAMED